MSNIVIQSTPAEYRRVMTIGDARGNFNNQIDSIDEARSSAEEYKKVVSEAKYQEFLEFLDASGYPLQNARPKEVNNAEDSKTERNNSEPHEGQEVTSQQVLRKYCGSGKEIVRELEKDLITSGYPQDLVSSFKVDRYGDKIIDRTKVLRTEAFRDVAAQLIDQFPNVPPIILYSLFYPNETKGRQDAIKYLEQNGTKDDVEKQRAKLLMDKLLGVHFIDDANLALLKLIDITRFENFGWLYSDTLDYMANGDEFAEITEKIVSKDGVQEGIDTLNRIDGKYQCALLKFIGEPDYYTMPWVITDAGHACAKIISGCLKAKIFLSVRFNNTVGGVDGWWDMCEKITDGLGWLVRQDPDNYLADKLRATSTRTNLGILLVHSAKKWYGKKLFALPDNIGSVHAKKMMGILINSGADPNFQGEWGTPLILAIYNQNVEAVRELIEAGADPRIKRYGARNDIYKDAKKVIKHDPEIREIIEDAVRKYNRK